MSLAVRGGPPFHDSMPRCWLFVGGHPSMAQCHDVLEILLLISFSSSDDADQDPRCRNPLNGGGPVVVIGSAVVENDFEFPAGNPGGGLEKSMYAT